MNKRLNVSLLALILCSVSLVLTLTTSSSLKVGSGFGRESKFVVNTQNVELLHDYLSGLDRRGIETDFVEISDYEFELTFSALENVDIIKSEISKVIPDVTFKYEGNFGNIGTYINNQGFVQTYLVLLIFFVCVYFSVRYRFWGIVTGIQFALAYSLAMLVLVSLKMPFTEMLWYTIVITLVNASLSKHSFIKNYQNTYPSDLVNKGFEVIKRPIHIGLLNLIFGLVIFNSSLVIGQSSGIFIIFFTLTILMSDFYISYALEKIILAFAADDNDNLKFIDSWKINKMDNVNLQLKRMSLVALGILMAIIVFLPQNIKFEMQGQDFDSKRVLIVSDSNPRSYLEVEAMLHSIGLFDKQISYSTSDQNQLWIYFEPTVSESDLKIARNIITNDLGIDVTSYITRSKPYTTESYEFYGLIVLLLILSSLTIRMLTKNRDFLNVLLLSALGMGITLVMFVVFAPEWKREFTLIIYFVPILMANHYSTPMNLDSLKDSDAYGSKFLFELLSLSTFVAMISALILIIVPIEPGVGLIESLTLLTISYELARFAYIYESRLIRKYVITDDDESY